MNERDIILVSGAPGSGKSRLGSTLAQSIAETGRTAEHVSTGDLVRAIGSGAIKASEPLHGTISHHLSDTHPARLAANGYEIPRSLTPLDDATIYKLLSRHLEQLRGTSTIILDGYPRYDTQVADFYRLIEHDDRQLRGVIVTETDTETALARQLKRHPRSFDQILTPEQALWRMEEHSQNAPVVYDRLAEQRYRDSVEPLPFEYINTSGDKNETTLRGLKFAREVLRLIDDDDDDAA